VLDHPVHGLGVAVRDVDRHVVGADAFARKAVDHLVVGALDARADRDDEVLLAHPPGERDVIDVEAVHDVEEAIGGEPLGDRLVDHRPHVRRHDRQGEAARPELDRGVAFGAALDAAFARQEQDVVVIEDFHGDEKKTGARRAPAAGF
jgi:hypothetical protein